MFELGLTGAPDSAARRDRLAEKLGLPHGMNANALCTALTMLSDPDEVRKLTDQT